LFGTENRIYIPIEEIPEYVRNAFLAAEDVRFYSHHGVDPIRILGALVANLRSGDLSQGASTITQQLVKNTHLTAEKTWSRKLEEAILALKVERAYTKDQILEMYVNCVYFGNGAYGIGMAAYAYFDKPVQELTLTEAAALAATLKAPSNYAPHIEPENNARRRAQILTTMAEEGFITAEQAEEAKSEPLVLQPGGEDLIEGSWYLDAVLEEAETRLGKTSEEILEMGLRIYTGLDSRVQAACDAVFTDSSLFPADSADGTPCQSALVLMDSQTGDVLAMVGGREYEVRRGFNRVTDGARQPGSTLKPLAVYAPALERRIATPATVLLDEPTDFQGYSPKNYGDVYYGPVTLRTAAARSLNVPAVRLLDQMGGSAGYESLLRFRIQPDETDTGLSLAVGSMKQGVTPLRLCAAYASLSASGAYQEPVLIRRIEDSEGKVLYEAESEPEQVLEESVAYVLTNLLRSAATWGTAKTLNALEIPIAAKTGTVDFADGSNRDAWAAAYTPSLAAVCWMGFDQTDAAHALPGSVTGGKQPAQLLLAVLSQLELPAEEFAEPKEGVTWAALDGKTLLQAEGQAALAGPYTLEEDVVWEVFVSGTEPTVVSDLRTLPQAPSNLTVESGENGLPLLRFTAPDAGAVYHIYRSYRDSAHEIAQVQADETGSVVFLDESAQRLYTYAYFVVAEFPDTGLLSESSASVSYTVPLLPFALPWDFGLSPTETPAPSPQEEPEASTPAATEPPAPDEPTPEPVETPEPPDARTSRPSIS
ncbi:MAG: PBP1A family penicillin-binding protein, partial [Candidatus Spyradocola sp.]